VSLPGLSAQESPMKLVGHRGSLYLFTTAYYASPYDLRLWRVDGTTGVELHRFPGEANFHSPYAGLNPIKLAPLGGTLYFNVTDGAHGIELWATDGTAAGTAMVADILPGPQSSAPGGLTAAGDRLYCAARDSLHGEELWQSDGTAAGTSLVQDIAPSAGWSSPGQLTVAGDHLFFTADDGLTGRELWALSLGASTACRPSSTRLCLSGGRYAVESTWQDFSGNHGVGHAAALTSDTGYFWFFSPSNVEVIVKLLDGDPVNGHAWVFYGALSNVGYRLTVTDTQTGLSRRYVNPPGQLASVGDVNAFGPLGASAKAWRAPAIRPSSPPVVTAGGTAPAPCVQGPTRLCLNGGRFAVDVAWKDFQGSSGVGQAQPLTSDTGWFWFFGPDNVEVVIKVLDGVPVNGHFWLFYGALSSVEYTLTVTDTQTGQMKTYRNPSGRLASVADVNAF
jgi:ELWxxDGT repeat protein